MAISNFNIILVMGVALVLILWWMNRRGKLMRLFAEPKRCKNIDDCCPYPNVGCNQLCKDGYCVSDQAWCYPFSAPCTSPCVPIDGFRCGQPCKASSECVRGGEQGACIKGYCQ